MDSRNDQYGYGYEDDRGYASRASGYDANAASNYSRERYGNAMRNSQANAQERPFDYASSDAQQYSRYNTGIDAANTSAQSRYNNMYADLARTKRKRSLGRRIFGIVGVLLLAVVLAGGAYALWFTHALDAALASDDDSFSALDEVLVPAVDGEPYYVLIMGSDSREGNNTDHADQRGDNERSDVMMLARVDASEKKVTLLTIPRDTAYRLADGSYIKINEMYNSKGAAGAVRAVSDLTGLPISHHASVRVSGLESIVDLLGGVTVDVPVDLSYTTMDNKEVTIKAGTQTLNGQEAQIFARARHEFTENQDQHRQSNVRQLLTAIIAKILDRPVPEIPGLVLKLAEYIDTDMRSLDAAAIAMAFAGGDVTIYTGTGPSDGDINEQAGGKWLCYPNPEGWAAVVAQVDAGSDPSDIDYTETQILWSDVTDQPDFKHSLAYHYYYGAHLSDTDEWLYGDADDYANDILSNADAEQAEESAQQFDQIETYDDEGQYEEEG